MPARGDLTATNIIGTNTCRRLSGDDFRQVPPRVPVETIGRKTSFRCRKCGNANAPQPHMPVAPAYRSATAGDVPDDVRPELDFGVNPVNDLLISSASVRVRDIVNLSAVAPSYTKALCCHYTSGNAEQTPSAARSMLSGQLPLLVPQVGTMRLFAIAAILLRSFPSPIAALSRLHAFSELFFLRRQDLPLSRRITWLAPPAASSKAVG